MGDRRGRDKDLSRTEPVVPPIYQSTTFRLDDQSYEDIIATGGLNETWYSRFTNPTVAHAAEMVRRLDGGGDAFMTSSGMGAIATTLLTLLRTGDRIVVARELYGDTRDLFVRDLPALGIEIDFVNVADIDGWATALSTGPVEVAYAEAMSNPQLRLLDIPTVAELAHAAGATLVVDATFASPFCVQPLSLGADIVVHSATKFLSGHSDVIAGVVVADEDTITEVQKRVISFGTSLDPHAAFLVSRGLKTFGVRLARQCDTAGKIAGWLADHEGITSVSYPGLSDHPDHDVAERTWQKDARGAMVTCVLTGGNEAAGRMMRSLRVITEATSLGGVESLASAPHNSSQFSYSAEELRLAGIEAGMVRLSIGLEDPEALISDLERALTSA